jgi:hypothetical protein
MLFRSLLLGSGLLAGLLACASPSADFTQYGDLLTLTEATNVSDVLADPEAYLGKHLLVEGTIVGSCKKMGHWIGLGGDRDGEMLRVWAEEGVAFPVDALGLHARAEGTWEKLELALEETIAQAEHYAEEHGEDFDPSSITGPSVIYQLLGSGAEVEDAG